MTKKQTSYCINCGEEIFGAKFCPKCGTKQNVDTANVNNNTNNNNITINVGASENNEKQVLTLEELIQKAQTQLEAKDFDSLKQTAKEIQTNFQKAFTVGILKRFALWNPLSTVRLGKSQRV